MRQTLIAVLMTTVFVAASLLALSMIEEVTSISQSLQSDSQTR
jgi:hypothetical protein